MADRLVSELTEKTFLASTDELYVESGLNGRKITAGNMAANFMTLGGVINVKDAQYGAVGDGVTDDAAAIQAAIDAAEAAGGGTVLFPPGTYLVSATLTIDSDNVQLLGSGPDRVIIKKSASLEFIQAGDLTLRVTTEANTLASNAASGDQTLTLSSGKGANITAGETIVLMSDATAEGGPSVTNTAAEFVHVFSIATDVLTLSAPIKFAHTTADNAEVQRINWLDGLHIEGIGFDGNGHTVGASVNDDNGMELLWCRRPVIKNVRMWELPNVGILLQGCYRGYLEQISGYDFLSDGIQGASGNFGYGIAETDLNEGLVATGLNFDRVRHGYTTGNFQLLFGVPMGSRISNGVAVNCRGSGWDTHPQGHDITFVNCQTLGSLANGIQLRGVRGKLVGCGASDCVGAGVLVSADGIANEIGDFTAVRTNQGTWNAIDWTTQDVIEDDGTGTLVDGLLHKKADQSVTSSTTLVDDNHLIYPIQPYARYSFSAAIRHNSGGTGHIKVSFDGPSGSAVRWSPVDGGRWNTSSVWDIVGEAAGGSGGNYVGSGGSRWIHFTGYIENGATAGDFKFQFAQVASDATATIVQANSYMKLVRR